MQLVRCYFIIMSKNHLYHVLNGKWKNFQTIVLLFFKCFLIYSRSPELTALNHFGCDNCACVCSRDPLMFLVAELLKTDPNIIS